MELANFGVDVHVIKSLKGDQGDQVCGFSSELDKEDLHVFPGGAS